VITGTVEVSPVDEHLLVEGRSITLVGLALQPTTDFSDRLGAWLARNGGQVRCVSRFGSYQCSTPFGDLGAALVASGLAVPQPDAPDDYKALAAPLQVRASVLGEAPGPALTSLLSGAANPHCQNPLTCLPRYLFVGYARNNAAIAREDWRALVENIIKVNFQNDINFYYLGRAAEAMGAYGVAATYYEKAYSLHQSPVFDDRCENLRDPLICGGVNLSAELPNKIRRARRLAELVF
jgi:hypothetical protein